MRRTTGKRTLLLLVVLALGGGGGVLWWRSRGTREEAPPPQSAEARRGNLAVEVTATGSVEPEYTVEIKSKASGTIQAIQVQAGDKVDKGALLIQIDPVVERRKLAQAEADLRMAQAQRSSGASKLEFGQAQLKRDEELHRKGLVAREAVDQLRKEVAVLQGDGQVAQAQVTRARASYEEAKDRLGETRLLAPMAGTILERSVNPGQVIMAGTNTGGQTLLTLANLSRLFVRVKVDEADVAKVALGQKVRITADALPGQVFSGSVLRVAPQGRVESSVTVFEVVVEVGDEGRERLRPMLTANVVIRVGEVKGALLVPRRAVQQQEGRTVVMVEGQGPRPVEVGLSDDRLIEIRSGISEGTRVVVPGARKTTTKDPKTGGMGAVPGLGRGVGGLGGGGR
jgi:RND family efflux transporter MFP subunit